MFEGATYPMQLRGYHDGKFGFEMELLRSSDLVKEVDTLRSLLSRAHALYSKIFDRLRLPERLMMNLSDLHLDGCEALGEDVGDNRERVWIERVVFELSFLPEHKCDTHHINFPGNF
jgi:hypothetical protein